MRQVNALIEANYKKIQHVISLKDIFKEQKIMMIGMKISEIHKCLLYWMQQQKDPRC